MDGWGISQEDEDFNVSSKQIEANQNKNNCLESKFSKNWNFPFQSHEKKLTWTTISMKIFSALSVQLWTYMFMNLNPNAPLKFQKENLETDNELTPEFKEWAKQMMAE